MYKYFTKVCVEDSAEECLDCTFHVVLRENMPFILNDCYFIIKKNHDHTFNVSDYLLVSYYSRQKNKKEAEEKIKRATELFVFMTDIPFTVNNAVIEMSEDNPPGINTQLSQRKMQHILEINHAYGKINGKKDLLQSVMQMYAMATKVNYLLSDINEDAFFIYFKLTEKIVKDDYSIEEPKIDRGIPDTKKYIKKILKNSYGIVTQDKRLDTLSGEISKYLFRKVFDNNIYHKIIWFLENHGIAYDKDIIARIVFLRNKIAHGEAVSMDKFNQEYSYIIDLTNKVIQAKFFNVNMKIEAAIKHN